MAIISTWRHWQRKFANAFYGIRVGMQGQSSFAAHLPAAVLVLIVAWLVQCSLWQWCVLGLCIAMVLIAELLNSALELFAREVCREHNEQVGKAMDVASGAVLVASAFAALIGAAIFAERLTSLFASS